MQVLVRPEFSNEIASINFTVTYSTYCILIYEFSVVFRIFILQMFSVVGAKVFRPCPPSPGHLNRVQPSTTSPLPRYSLPPLHLYPGTAFHHFTSTQVQPLPLNLYPGTAFHHFTSTQVQPSTTSPLPRYSLPPLHLYPDTAFHHFTSTPPHTICRRATSI